MIFTFALTATSVTLRPEAPSGLLSRLIARRAPDLDHLPEAERPLAVAMADLRSLAEETGESLEIADHITLSHRLAARVDAETARAIGLPGLTDLTLSTDAEGLVGTPGFRLSAIWSRSGQRRTPARTGAFLQTDRGWQRLPLWMLEAVEIAEGHKGQGRDDADWEALARFRQAIDPAAGTVARNKVGQLVMTGFLSGLQVSLADRFAISPDAEGETFEVVPFSGRSLADAPEGEITETMGSLIDDDLSLFRNRLAQRGALNAYRLGSGRYLVVDRGAAPALKVMAEMQRAAPEVRRAFIRNPRARITLAVEAALDASGALDNLSDAGREEAVEKAAGPILIETVEYQAFSGRVTGVGVYEGNPLGTISSSGMTWLPEIFNATLAGALRSAPLDRLEALRDQILRAMTEGQQTVAFDTLQVPATPASQQEVEALISVKTPLSDDPADAAEDDDQTAPIILQTADNFETLAWRPERGPRVTTLSTQVLGSIRTAMKPHQKESLTWQVEAWKAGLPGVLNADEQGLGKTLQTIAFLVWLNEHMKTTPQGRGPILVVAPTSLLENWENEVSRHVEMPGLGHLIRLYGSATRARKAAGTSGFDTDQGLPTLDFTDLEKAIQTGAGHLTWVLTTYTTLTNYQHSLQKIRFAAVVFDEIQAVKNPGSLRAFAARSVNAEFRIGLTGTPIENETSDLWAIMDQLAPGALGTLRDFRSRYGEPDERLMAELHGRVFHPQGDLPPLSLRRLKDQVARDLPPKTRYLHPRLMPAVQSAAYEVARRKLAEGGMGAVLKMLHHIRSVSVHPGFDGLQEGDFISASARLQAVFDILRRIRARNERALVFIEHLKVQHRFAEAIRREFNLSKVDIINGETPIPKRQAIVDRFQRHLDKDGGFDLLILGPRAAGTGLTLTAATHVIHLSRWWNPAVEEQCNDRVHRLGQTRPVTVHVPLAIHPDYGAQSFDLVLQSLMNRKRRLAQQTLWPMGDDQGDVAALQAMLGQEAARPKGDVLTDSMATLFLRDGLPMGKPDAEGAWVIG
ncbi:DEAD/DEAH box helicase [Rhodobacter sp. KR11]|uniref:DEAD/DEAH box helicase n=1 Tax=Rhodobacter sp. KR11 TaxID=2974588 RepID=UPI002221721B|nr:DEAD/DEAH box helicase [Rhodobacter sp. KR11]MCW1918028.1 DEAD/DEAH box helicase [Rhodobacter sp. KR11]